MDAFRLPAFTGPQHGNVDVAGTIERMRVFHATGIATHKEATALIAFDPSLAESKPGWCESLPPRSPTM